MRIARIATLATATTLLATAAPARAAEDAPHTDESWGRRGQLVIPNLLGYSFATGPSVAPSGPVASGPTGIFGYAHGHADGQFDNPAAAPSASGYAVTDTFWFNPAADWFVADRVSIGGALLVGNQHYRYDAPGASGWENNTFFAGVSARVGYAVPLTRDLSLWPHLGGGYTYLQLGDGSVSRSHIVEAKADLPLVVRAGRYLYASLGLQARYAVSDDAGVERLDIVSTRANGFAIGGAFDAGLTF